MDEMETCSWCLNEVPDSSLKETDNGRLCPPCYDEDQAARLTDEDGKLLGYAR